MAQTEAEWLALIERYKNGDRTVPIENIHLQIATTPNFYSQRYAANVLKKLGEANPQSFWGDRAAKAVMERLATLPYGRDVLVAIANAHRLSFGRSNSDNLDALLVNPANQRLAMEIARADPQSVFDSFALERAPLAHRIPILQVAAQQNPIAALRVFRTNDNNAEQQEVQRAIIGAITPENAIAYLERDPAAAVFNRTGIRSLLSDQQVQQAMERVARTDPALLTGYPDIVRQHNLTEIIRTASQEVWQNSISRHAYYVLRMRPDDLSIPWPNAEEMFKQAAAANPREALRILDDQSHPYRAAVMQAFSSNPQKIDAIVNDRSQSLRYLSGYHAMLPDAGLARFETQVLERLKTDPTAIRDIATYTGPRGERLFEQAFQQNPYNSFLSLSREGLRGERLAQFERLVEQNKDAINRGHVSSVMESLVRDNPAERLLTLDQRTVNGRVVIGVTPNEQRMLELAVPKIMADHKLNEADARRLASEYVQQHFRQPPTTLPNLSVLPGNRVQPNTTTLMISPEDLSASTTEIINRMVSHAALAEAIRQNGGRVEVLKGPDHQGSGIELWTRDSYLRVGNQIFFPNNSTGEYSGKKDEDMRRDATALTQFFNQRGIKTTQTDIPFQGGDMMVDEQRKIILYGMQPGGNREQYEQNAARLQQLTGYRTVVVERSGYRTQIGDAKDQTLYHLDLITSVLPNGRLMVFPPGLTARSMEDLRKIYGNNIVTIQNGEEQTAVANATYVGNVMIANQVPERLRAELLKQGIRVVSASDIGPNINFTFGQGSVHCLTNEIPTSSPTVTPTSTPSRRADADKDRSGLRFSELQDYKGTGTPSLPALPTASIAALPTEIITPSASTSSTPSSTPTAVPTSSPSGSPSSSPAASSSPTSTPTVAKKAAAIAAPGRTA